MSTRPYMLECSIRRGNHWYLFCLFWHLISKGRSSRIEALSLVDIAGNYPGPGVKAIVPGYPSFYIDNRGALC